MATTDDAVAEVWDDWQDAVNLTAKQLEDFLDTDESSAVGDKGSGGESTGHASGRRLVQILRTNKTDLTADGGARVRKVVGYDPRHRARRPGGEFTETEGRY